MQASTTAVLFMSIGAVTVALYTHLFYLSRNIHTSETDKIGPESGVAKMGGMTFTLLFYLIRRDHKEGGDAMFSLVCDALLRCVLTLFTFFIAAAWLHRSTFHLHLKH